MTFLSLDNPIRWLFLAHAMAGALALFILLIPLLSKKGGSIHVKTGWVYTAAMCFVGVSAFVITPWRAFVDPNRTTGSITFSVFLFYVAVFTLSSIAFGLSALKSKARKTVSRSPLHLIPPAATVGFGIVAQIIGLHFGNTLLIAFPFLGHLTAINQLKYWLRIPSERMHWWYAHMNGMFVACIATITAFLVTALPRVAPGPMAESPVLWIAPGLILGTVLNRWTARFKIKYEKRPYE